MKTPISHFHLFCCQHFRYLECLNILFIWTNVLWCLLDSKSFYSLSTSFLKFVFSDHSNRLALFYSFCFRNKTFSEAFAIASAFSNVTSHSELPDPLEEFSPRKSWHHLRYEGGVAKGKIWSEHWKYVCFWYYYMYALVNISVIRNYSQRHIYNSIKHLIWSFLQKWLTAESHEQFFCNKLYLRCLTGFLMHPWFFFFYQQHFCLFKIYPHNIPFLVRNCTWKQENLKVKKSSYALYYLPY